MRKRTSTSAIRGLAAGAIVIVLALNTVYIIPTGYTGVKTSFGKISENTLESGSINFAVPFVQNIKKVNNKQQDKKYEGKVWGEASDKTPVYGENVIVTYNIEPEKSSWLYANVTDMDELVKSGMVASALKSAMVELGPEEVTNRGKIEPLVQKKLQEALDKKYGKNTVAIYQIVIENMDFEDAYNAAVQQKSIAQQTAEKQKIENETAIAKAEADKKVAITNAKAKAEKMKIEAEAQAEANKKLTDSISDALIDYEKIEKWDGKLPKVTGGNTIVSLDGDEEATDTAGSGDSGNSEK